jgi:hypothetical protein
MIATLRKVCSLDPADRRLLFEAIVLLAIAWVGLQLLRYATTEAVLRHLAARAPASGPTDTAEAAGVGVVGRVRWSVTAAASRMPGANSCLTKALAVRTMLARRAIDAELRFGVRGRPAKSDPAHAWVECRGGIVIGEAPDLPHYTALSMWRS